ncbi:Hypothetical_protein [Hexamita inflata]|uniref:Hypothetical_protein n=1 Tax=Hexamita inflata TaxID=28002 RepID=A0ABP1L358_9EUKA
MSNQILVVMKCNLDYSSFALSKNISSSDVINADFSLQDTQHFQSTLTLNLSRRKSTVHQLNVLTENKRTGSSVYKQQAKQMIYAHHYTKNEYNSNQSQPKDDQNSKYTMINDKNDYKFNRQSTMDNHADIEQTVFTKVVE